MKFHAYKKEYGRAPAGRSDNKRENLSKTQAKRNPMRINTDKYPTNDPTADMIKYDLGDCCGHSLGTSERERRRTTVLAKMIAKMIANMVATMTANMIASMTANMTANMIVLEQTAF